VAALAVAAAAFVAGRALSSPPASTAPTFQRLTFRRGVITSAAFMPDGATVVYAMRANGENRRVYSARVDNPDSVPLAYDRADVVSISSKGELALVVKRQNLFAYANPGMLQRASLSGAARDVLDQVQDADWLPDGSSLAVARYVDGKFRLEFPIGKAVYETTGWVTDVRVARDGRSVAFLDHPILGDDRGAAAVVDASGAKRTISAECESTQGLAWSPTGHEVWFTCSGKGLARSLEAATLDGRQRSLLRIPGSLRLAGVARDASVLLWTDLGRRGAAALLRGETRERDISWFDWTNPVALSDDGTTLLFTEEGEGGGPGYGVYLRTLDGSPAVRLGSGNAMALSADGKWVIARASGVTPAQLMLLPTGVGEARPLTNDALTHESARFLPDGTRFVFIGAEPGKAARTWVQSLDGSKAVPITPEGFVGTRVTPDGTAVLIRKNGVWRLHPIAGGGEPKEITVIAGSESPVRFTADGRALLIRRPARPDGGVEVVRVDLATGARTPVRTVMPVDDAINDGGVSQLLMTPDGAVYVQGYQVTQSDLYLVKGLR
jgi:Tol biopolymer transport system component